MEPSKDVKLCLICCYSFQNSPSPAASTASCTNVEVDFKEFIKFCGQLENMSTSETEGDDDGESGKYSLKFKPDKTSKVSLCRDCSSMMKDWLHARDLAKERETVVNFLQRQLLNELRILEGFMEECCDNLRKMEEVVRRSDENCLFHVLGGDEEGRRDVEWVRRTIVKVGGNFRFFKTSHGGSLEGTDGSVNGRSKQWSKDKDLESEIVQIKVEPETVENENENDPVNLETWVSPEELIGQQSELDGDLKKAKKEPGNIGRRGSKVKRTNSDGGMNSNSLLDSEESRTGHSDDDEGDEYCGDEDYLCEDEDNEMSNESVHLEQGSGSSSTTRPSKRSRSRSGSRQRKRKKFDEAELSNFFESSGIQLDGMSEIKKNFVVAIAKQKLVKGSEAEDNKDEEDDDFWFRRKYKLEYSPDHGFSLGGIGIVLNEEDCCFECSLCSFRISLPKSGKYEGEGPRRVRVISQHVFASHLGLYRCRICNDGKCYKSEGKYRNHMKMHRDGANACDICGKQLSRRDALEYHRFTHMNAEEKEEAKRKGIWKEPKTEVSDGTSHQCSICSKSFPKRSYLKQHMDCHQEDREKVQCEECGKTMLRCSYDSYHKKYGCPGPGREIFKIPCLLCDQTFKTRVYLNRHIARAHSGQQRSFICEVCGKGFKCRDDLAVHKPLHNDKLEFKCKKCGKEFAVRRYWRNHESKCSVHVKVFS